MLPSLLCLDPFRATLPQPVPLPGHLLAHRTSPPCSQPVPWPQHRRAWKCCKRVSEAGCKTSLSFDHVPQVFTCCVSKPFAFWQDIFHLPSTRSDRVSWGILDHSRFGASAPAALCFGCSSLGLCREDGSALGPAAGRWGGQCCGSPRVPARPGGGGARVAL